MSVMIEQPTRVGARAVPLHVVHDPQPGEELIVPAGCRLAVRFRRRGHGLSRWHLVDRPGHLLPLEVDDHGFLFLVFDGGDDRPLRLGRRRVDRDEHEVRDLTVRVG